MLASALAQLSHGGIMLVDQSGRIIVASSRALRILRRDHQQLVGQLLSELTPDLAPAHPRSDGPRREEDDYDGRLVELQPGEFARISVTPVPDGGLIASAVRIEPADRSDGGTERNIERYDAFLGQIARHLARYKTAPDALEGVVALTAAALEIPSSVAFVLNGDGSHDAYAHNMPPSIAESAFRYFKARDCELDDQPVVFDLSDNQPQTRLLRDARLRSAMASRIAQSERGMTVLAAFSKMDDRFGAVEKTLLRNIARLLDGFDTR